LTPPELSRSAPQVPRKEWPVGHRSRGDFLDRIAGNLFDCQLVIDDG
jgi:hypothetical protein